MLQETNSPKSTKKSDFMLILFLLVLLIVSKAIISAFSSFSYGGLVQIGVFLLCILDCYLLFKRRLASYRYTLFNSEPGELETDEYGQPAKNPFPLGTFIAEQVTSGRGRIIEIIQPGELDELIPPGGLSQKARGPLPKAAVLTVCGQSASHILTYRRNEKLRALRFSPSEDMQAALGEIISAVNVGRHSCD